MKAVIVQTPGGPEQMQIGEWETPLPQKNQIQVKVKATALNRADTLQRMGKYPPPPGASPILGLEIAGEVSALGENVNDWQLGDKVFGLVPGGAYAEYACIHKDMALAMPDYFSFEQAAAIPEVFLTAFQALLWLGDLKAEDKVLIHAGASGVGTAAIQIAREIGAEIWVTASAAKHSICLELGAKKAIDYRKQDFAEILQQDTQGSGVNLIIDFIAANYLKQNLQALATEGRLVLLALMGGAKAQEVNLATILRKRLRIEGSTLRARSIDYQIRLTQALQEFAQSRWETGKLKPIIDQVFDWKEVSKAHQYMEANKNIGKIVLNINS